MSEIHGRDAGDLKKYRTEIPNVVFTLGLDPYALTLYCHLKRTTGAADGGLCYKSTRTLADETGMSAGKVSEARAPTSCNGPRRQDLAATPSGVVREMVAPGRPSPSIFCSSLDLSAAFCKSPGRARRGG